MGSCLFESNYHTKAYRLGCLQTATVAIGKLWPNRYINVDIDILLSYIINYILRREDDMEWLEASLGPAHAAFGFVGLAAFWVPVLSKKGGGRHVWFGRVFLYCAYAVLATAGVAVVYRLGKLLAAGSGPSTEPVLFAFLLFLGYLALTTFVTVRHAIGVLRTKRDPDVLATPLNIAMARTAIAASLLLIGYALYFRPPIMILLLALSPIGLGNGYGILKYLGGNRRSPRQWLYEHLGGMLAAGIAFHTAFAVFGVSQLFNFRIDGWVGILPWVLPGVVGTVAIVVWTRHYQRKFGETRAVGEQSAAAS